MRLQARFEIDFDQDSKNSIWSVIRSSDYRIIFLFLACAVYAAFGSPTPSTMGFAEIVIAALLVLAIGFVSVRDALMPSGTQSAYHRFGIMFMLYGLIVGLCVGAMSGHAASAMIRDIIPFLFLFLPIFLTSLIVRRPEHFSILLCAVVMIGVVFSARSLFFVSHEEMLYLENMPTVLFAALFLSGLAFERLVHGKNLRSVIFAGFCLLAALLPLAAMAVTHQRASLGAMALYGVLLFAYFLYWRPKRTVLLAVLGLIVIVMWPLPFWQAWRMITEKTEAVGFNMRPQEMMAVWAVVTQSPQVFLFGIGWGGHFHSPAVGGMNVNFTHNFFSSVLLKTGFCGVLLAGVYIIALLKKLSQVLMQNPVLGIALCAPVLIDLTLYASFKSLDFGLMLLMISAAVVYSKNSRIESTIAESRCADRLLCS